jgi:integrase
MGGKHIWQAKYNGVNYQSKSALRINFTYQGKQRFEKIECDPDQEQSWQIAAEAAYDIKREIRDGTFDYKRWFPESKKAQKYAPSGGAFLKDYLPYANEVRLAGIPKLNKTPLAQATYVTNIRTIKRVLTPAFGNICVDEINADDVYKWADHYGKKVQSSTLANILSPLKVSLDIAVLEQKIKENPLKGITVYGLPKTNKLDKHDPFNKEEIKALLSSGDEFSNYLRFAIFTGLRPSEQIALTWQDYSETMKTIRVDKGFSDDDYEVSDLKTPAAYRVIHLSPTAIYALDCQKKHTKPQNAEIFVNPYTKEMWTGSTPIRQRFRLLCKNVGVRYRKPYQTRHTYATINLSVGENPAFISQQMGHTDLAFTLKTYASYIMNKSNAGFKADSAFTDLDTKTKKLLEFIK